MDFKDPRSKTVISTSITLVNQIPENYSIDEIKEEVFEQLQINFPTLQEPTYTILSPDVYYNINNNSWYNKDTAFIATKYGYYPSHSSKYPNIYMAGVQNGNSNYSFTSFESAVENAICLINELEPSIKIPIQKIITLNDVIKYSSIAFFIIIIIIFYIKIIKIIKMKTK